MYILTVSRLTPRSGLFQYKVTAASWHSSQAESGRESKADKRLRDICRKTEDSGYDKAKERGSFCPFSEDP